MGHEPELLSSSIGDNVTLGDRLDPDTYLRMTSMDKDLKEMRRTSGDAAGEAGSMLSGGQQSRLALARTLAHVRSVLVLDDPFSSVDRQVETDILQRIRQTYPNRIILMISHRLYHFPEFDRVLALLIILIAGFTIASLLPPLVLEQVVNRLSSRQSASLGLAFLYFAFIVIALMMIFAASGS